MLSIAQVLIGPHLLSISVKTTKIGHQEKYYIENSQNTTVGSKGKSVANKETKARIDRTDCLCKPC